MANSKSVSLRIPDELLSKIDAKAEQEYKTIKGTSNRSLVILEILDNYFNTLSDNVSNSTNDNIVSDTAKQLNIEELKQYIDNDFEFRTEQLQNQINALSDIVDNIRDSLHHHTEKIETSIGILSDNVNTVTESFDSRFKQLELELVTLLDNVNTGGKQAINSDMVSNITVDDSVNETRIQTILLSESSIKNIRLNGGVLSSLRFGLHKDNLSKYKSRNPIEKVIQWTKEKDPDGIGWIPNPEGSGYVPEPETSIELLDRLRTWIEENISKK